MTNDMYRTNEAPYPQTGEVDDRDPEAERLVAEIAQTRSGMGATIDEIGHRLQPSTIADEAKEKIREATVGRVERIVDDAGQTAQRTGNTIMETIRQNPVPAALAGIGIGWLALRMRDQGSNGNGSSRYGYSRGYSGRASYATRDYGYGGDYGYRGDYGSYGSGSQAGALSGVQGVAGEAAERVQQVGSDIQRAAASTIQDSQARVQDVQWQAQNAIQDAQWKAQNTIQDAQWQFDRTYNENPLALGALAVGVGAAIALAIPATSRERELMGEQRDKLVEQVSTVASQALDQAQEKAQETAQQVTETIRSEG